MSNSKPPKTDSARVQVKVTVRRFEQDIDEFRALYGKARGEELFFANCLPTSEDTLEGELACNLLMTAGADLFWKGLTTAGLATPYNNANSYLGVGDSSTAEAAGQTDLQAATNKVRQAMDATYPQHTTGTNSAVFSATFGSGSANFAWNEWAVFNGSSGNTMLNRKVASLGTKTTGSWQLQATLTLA